MAPIRGDQLRGHLENLVLSVLERGPAHGWDIARRLEQQAPDELQLKEGSLYPALYRLEHEKLVASRWDKQNTASRGPRRRVYQLTRAGHRRLAEARVEWRQFVAVLGNLLGAPA
jgi:DNA-binding PadR family transcriptional regulator